MDDFSKNRENAWKNIDEAYYARNSKSGIPSRKLITKYINNQKITSVLELGCNSGGNLLMISRECPKVKKLVGIDICENAIKYGKEVENNLADMIVGSIYDLSGFEDNSFDLVFTRGVLLHINHEAVPGVIQEMMRISKRHIVHVEWHGENKVRSISKGVPHAFSHDFNALYEGVPKVKIKDVNLLTGKPAKGGANHLIKVVI